MNNILVISLEWIDILYIKGLEIYRTSNNDKGFFKKINNKLIIDWDNWGEETFVEYDKNIFYKDKYNKFNINIESESEYDEAELNIQKREIELKNMKKKGNYKFINSNLVIKWNYTKEEEIYYMYNYGRLFSTRRNSVECYNKRLIKNIAILFPQFHEIPENNKFWGKGFTEWTLLKKLPEQLENEIIKKPHDDLGYYNLKDLNHRIFVENMARKHEIHGFCYYHYWFKNKKIMYEPIELMLKDGHPNQPYMFCWANEQWTKRWDGGNNEVLIEQDYDDYEGNKSHYKYLLNFFKHKKYIKIKNKPVFIFYRIEEKDKKSIELIIKSWNTYAKEDNFSGIHFMRFLGPFDNNVEIEGIEGYINFEPGITTQQHGLDILSYNKDNLIFNNENEYNEEDYLNKNKDVERSIKKGEIESGLIHYKSLNNNEKLIRTSKFNVHCGNITLEKIKTQKIIKDNHYLGIFVGWNNFPRRNYTNKNYDTYPLYYKEINIDNFGETYDKVLENTNNTSNNSMDMIFITSWNEWNEQSSLEPNNYDGYNYLSEVKNKYYDFYKFKKTKKILIFSHKGGGTEKYINDLKKIYLNYNLVFYDEKLGVNNYTDIDFIHINSFFMMNLMKNYIIFFKNNFQEKKKIITIHDYQWIYPDDPNILSYNFNNKKYEQKNVENFLELLNLCNKIIFPSYNILKNYNEIINLKNLKDRIFVIPHCDKFIDHNKLIIPKIEKYINVAYIGNFIEYKGSKVFKYLFDNIKYFNGHEIKYHVFGYLSDEEKDSIIKSNNFIYHYHYNEDEIQELFNKNDIHIITHLSLFEESYCYALTDSINSGRPIIYINHGAITERLINIPKYISTSFDKLLLTFNKILKFTLNNQNIYQNNNKNNKLQNNKWYINNY